MCIVKTKVFLKIFGSKDDLEREIIRLINVIYNNIRA